MHQQRSAQPNRVHQLLSILALVGLLFSAFPGALLARTDEAVTGQEGVTPILVGEFVQQMAAEGDVYAYTVFLPEEGDYMISPDNEEAAASFVVAIYDADGEAVYEGPLAMEPVTLAAGEYTLEVTAEADNELSFFVLGMIGGMSESERSPGKLYPGSIYAEEDVSDSRYATITIPDVGYPQEVLLYFQTGEGDSFSLSVSGGESTSIYANSDDTDMLRFYSQGGAYTFTVDPWERRSEFTAIVFLAGPPLALEIDGELEATIAADAQTQLFHLTIDDVYDDVTVTLTPAEGTEIEPSLTVVDRYEGGTFYTWGETQDDGSIVASTGALLPGDYYINVTKYEAEDVAYTLSATGTPGAPMLPLALDEVIEGTLEDGGVQYFRLDDVEAGTFVRVNLASEAEGVDFDLHVGQSQPLEQWTSTTTGANEEVILVAPGDGTYYAKVVSYSGAGDYQLLAEEIADVGLIETNEVHIQTIRDDGLIVYGFAIDEPGQLLSVLLASQDAADLDLSVVHYGPRGATIHSLSSASTGSSEIVSQAAAEAGIYEVRVRAFGEGGDFVLLVRVENPASLLGTSSDAPSAVGEVVMSDDFSDPDSGWPVDDEADAYGYVDETYLIAAEPGVYRWVKHSEEAYSDVSLEVELSLASGNADAYAGLLCRTTDDGYYYVDISPMGDFTMGQLLGDDVIPLAEWADSDAIDTDEGAVNLLRLDCIGDTMSAYANGQLLASVTVEEIEGGVGFEAGNLESAQETAIFLFDNLVVRQP